MRRTLRHALYAVFLVFSALGALVSLPFLIVAGIAYRWMTVDSPPAAGPFDKQTNPPHIGGIFRRC